MGVHKYGGVVAGRREGGHLLAEWGARRGWRMEGLGGVRSPGDRALGALESPEAVGVAGWGEGEVARLVWGGGEAGRGGVAGVGVAGGDGGVEVLESPWAETIDGKVVITRSFELAA